MISLFVVCGFFVAIVLLGIGSSRFFGVDASTVTLAISAFVSVFTLVLIVSVS
jgi:hypothetical protein